MPHDTRDEIVDFVRDLAAKTEIVSERRIIGWLGIARGKFFKWANRYGKANEHNGKVPRDTWILPEERQAILDFHERYPLEGYRRLAFMMIDQEVVAVSPTTVYRVLHGAGRLDRWNKRPSKKGTGFVGPEKPHAHWHVDIAYLNLGGTFYYFCGVLDGFSRAIVHWDIREAMTELDIELVLQSARERYPDVKPRVITDNGPQFIAKDFKEFIRVTGMTHVRITPYYPQSNGKIERFNKSLKSEAIRPANPQTIDDARAVVTRFIAHYNDVRLHSGIDYVAPTDMLQGRHDAILKQRDRRLEAARDLRRKKRQDLARRMGIPDDEASLPEAQAA